MLNTEYVGKYFKSKTGFECIYIKGYDEVSDLYDVASFTGSGFIPHIHMSKHMYGVMARQVNFDPTNALGYKEITKEEFYEELQLFFAEIEKGFGMGNVHWPSMVMEKAQHMRFHVRDQGEDILFMQELPQRKIVLNGKEITDDQLIQALKSIVIE